VPGKVDIQRGRQRATRVFGNQSEEHFVVADGGLEDLTSERAGHRFGVMHLMGKLEFPPDRGDHVEFSRRRGISAVNLDLSVL